MSPLQRRKGHSRRDTNTRSQRHARPKTTLSDAKPARAVIQAATACGSYTWTAGTGLTYTTGGSYNYYSTGANGCADTVTLNLTINNGVHTTQTATACGSYTWTAGTGLT